MSDSELTRFADAAWAPLVRGQRISVKHGDFSGDYRVMDITPGHDGSETYHLEPAAEVDAREARARMCRCAVLPIDPEEDRGEPATSRERSSH